MARIYTRTGDDGTTGLIGGLRVSKDAPAIEACGSLDELNAILGVVRSHPLPDRVLMLVRTIQESLIAIGAELATPQGTQRISSELSNEAIRYLEKEIDAFEDHLPPLKQFILPGGSLAGSHLHMARAIARRAERNCVSLSRIERINPSILCYLNRLSDLFFVLARYVDSHQSSEVPSGL